MKNIVCCAVLFLVAFQTFAQPQGLLDEVWYVRYITFNSGQHFTPLGENLSLSFTEKNDVITLEANGIVNQFTADVTFIGNTISTINPFISLSECTQTNCSFENDYFYEVLTDENLAEKTFTYTYSQYNSNQKTLWFQDSASNRVYLVNRPIDPNPAIFQKWYLYSAEADLGEDISFYYGPDVPSITIAPDFSFTGNNSDGVPFAGNFIYGEDFVNFDEFLLIVDSINTQNTDIPDLIDSIQLRALVASDFFSIESFPGFISSFNNEITLDVPGFDTPSITLYPNPAKEIIHITASDQIKKITVFSLLGEKVFSAQQPSQTIDISFLKAGVYFVAFETQTSREIKTFIKK